MCCSKTPVWFFDFFLYFALLVPFVAFVGLVLFAKHGADVGVILMIIGIVPVIVKVVCYHQKTVYFLSKGLMNYTSELKNKKNVRTTQNQQNTKCPLSGGAKCGGADVSLLFTSIHHPLKNHVIQCNTLYT